MKKSILLASVAAFALTAPAFAADESYKSETKIEKDADGDYSGKQKTVQTNAAGTTTTDEKKVKVDVDSDGNVDKTVKTEHSTDPKGLFNKETVKTKDSEKTKDGATEGSHKKTVNGKTVEDTSTKH